MIASKARSLQSDSSFPSMPNSSKQCKISSATVYVFLKLTSRISPSLYIFRFKLRSFSWIKFYSLISLSVSASISCLRYSGTRSAGN